MAASIVQMPKPIRTTVSLKLPAKKINAMAATKMSRKDRKPHHETLRKASLIFVSITFPFLCVGSTLPQIRTKVQMFHGPVPTGSSWSRPGTRCGGWQGHRNRNRLLCPSVQYYRLQTGGLTSQVRLRLAWSYLSRVVQSRTNPSQFV